MNRGTVAEVQPRGLLGALEETYSFRGLRVGAACVGLALGVGSLLLFISGQAIWGLCLALAVARFLWSSVHEPYEVRIAPSGQVTVTSVTCSSAFPAAAIMRLVRYERRSNGKLSSIRVEHTQGSVSLPGREPLFRRLTTSTPRAEVSTEEYDDTSD